MSPTRIFLAGIFLGAASGASVAVAVGVYFDRHPRDKPLSAEASCVEQTRIIQSATEGWTMCPHPQHMLVERPIGYGLALVSCSCKPPGAPGDPGPAMIETPDPNWDAGADANPYPDPMKLDSQGRPQ